MESFHEKPGQKANKNLPNVQGKQYHIEPYGQVTFIKGIKSDKLPKTIAKGLEGSISSEVNIEKTAFYKEYGATKMKNKLKKAISTKIK